MQDLSFSEGGFGDPWRQLGIHHSGPSKCMKMWSWAAVGMLGKKE
jgi:hypothetical protein